MRIKAGWSDLGMYGEIFPDRRLPIKLERKVFSQDVLPTVILECQTWSSTKALSKRSWKQDSEL